MRRALRRPEWMSSLQLFSLLAAAATLVLIVAAGTLAVVDRSVVVDAPVPEPAGWFAVVQMSSAIIWMAASLSLMQRRDLAWSRLAAIIGLSHALAAACYGWAVHGLIGGQTAPGAAEAAAMVGILLPVEMPVAIFMAVSLPSGRLTRVGSDRLGWLAVSMATAGVLVQVFSEPDVGSGDFEAARNPLSSGIAAGPLTALLIAPAALLATCLVVVKWRRSHGADRVALRWVAVIDVVGTIVVVPSVAFASPGVAIGIAQIAGALGLLALVTVIRRQQLLGVERLLERTLRFVLLAALLLALYAVVVVVASELIGGAARPFAAVFVALAVLPIRDRIAVAVNRFVYGERANAAAIVKGVADQAANALTPHELADGFLRDLVAGTGASSASIVLDGHGTIASSGVQFADHRGAHQLPLHHRGSVIGRLIVEPGDGEVCLDPLAERVAAEVAPHVAIVAAACRTDIELLRARSRLIQGREEERRRLRHDLHDGLGPILTGVAFSTDAASNLVHTDPAAATAMLSSARRDVTAALDEIRRIVDDLRPPALDELGLVGAIRQHAQRLPQLAVTVSGDVPEPHLPAAVEVAAYRIVTEALTNVARHSDAGRADVGVTLNGQLAVTITDDGTAPALWRPGVGLASMRDRAQELGGDLDAGPGPTGGGRVVASLPVEAT